MGDDHSGWIAVLEIPGIPQIWVEEWIGKSSTITKIPDFAKNCRGEGWGRRECTADPELISVAAHHVI